MIINLNLCAFVLLCVICVPPVAVAQAQALPVPQLKSGKATLKGTLSGYSPEENAKAEIIVDDPVTGVRGEYETPVRENGTFELEVTLPVTMQVLFILSEPYCTKTVLLSPGETSTVRFDLPLKDCLENRDDSLKCPGDKYIYFDGTNAGINNQMEDINLSKLTDPIYNDKDYDRIAEMTPGQYKSHTLDKVAALTAELQEKGLTREALEFATGAVRYAAVSNLMFTLHNLKDAFRESRKLDYDDPELQKINQQQLEPDFYSFLKELSVNDPYVLYYRVCYNIINSCQYLDTKGVHISFTHREVYQALIDSGKLLPEEMEAAVYLRDHAFDNPDAKETLKSNLAMTVREIMNTGRLNEEYLEKANRMLALYADTSTVVLTALEQLFALFGELMEKEVFTEEDIYNIQRSVDNRHLDSAFVKVEALLSPFHKKYSREIDQMDKQIEKRESFATLTAILGTGEGIAFDLLESQSVAKQMGSFTPLTNDDLQPFAQKKNRFYFDYLTEKNSELLAKIERNKLKGGYTVHEAPETDGEQAFSEIVKPFAGKVVFIDFWNTWCGPCLSAMKKFEPAKAVFKEKGVVFIYLADESSPVDTWNNMIPDIPGEHFRLKERQMKELKGRFGIRGIPSYLILNRQGEQIYFRTGYDGDEIERTIDENLKI
jgi:thiol-disulfide isomerase/thioredoxin